MSRRERIADFARVAAATMRRRLQQGPRHPSWSWQYEILVDYLRTVFQTSHDLHELRRFVDEAGDWELRRNRVAWEAVSAGGVPGEWARPPEVGDRVVLHLHGGGYTFGSVRSHRTLLAGMARAGRFPVLAVNYRLAPEHPCPAALEDAVAVWRWLLDQGLDPARAVISGDSAGGGLALATLVTLRDAGLPLPAGAVLLSPWTDLEVTGESCVRFAEDDYLGTPERLYEAGRWYAGDLDRRDWRVSPLYADLGGLPPMLVVAGGVEVLLDDSVRLAERAGRAGVSVALHVAPEEIHVFPAFAELTPRGRDALALIGRFVAGLGEEGITAAGSS